MLSSTLSRDLDVKVIGTAPDPVVARKLILEHEPDVMTLEIDLPLMDGITFLRDLAVAHPLPAVLVTSAMPGGGLVRAALAAGASDVVHKPRSWAELKAMSPQLLGKVKLAACAGVAPVPDRPARAITAEPSKPDDAVIAIGAALGGGDALEYVLTNLPESTPGTVVVLQLPDGHVRELAFRMEQRSRMKIRMAEDGDSVSPGVALVSPGNAHLVVWQSRDGYFVRVRPGPLVHCRRPSIDMMFLSVAAAAGRNSIGIVLAGLGTDGMHGLESIHRAGGRTLAQAVSDALLWPQARAAERTIALERLPEEILWAGRRRNDADMPRRFRD